MFVSLSEESDRYSASSAGCSFSLAGNVLPDGDGSSFLSPPTLLPEPLSSFLRLFLDDWFSSPGDFVVNAREKSMKLKNCFHLG